MKLYSVLFVVLLMLVASCGGNDNPIGGKKGKISKEELYGDWEGSTYSNPLFNFEVEMSDVWDYDTTHFQTSFGGTVIHATSDLNGEISDLITFHVEFSKLNPFEGNPTAIEEMKKSNEASSFLYGSEYTVFEPMTTARIAGEEFVQQETRVADGEDSWNMIEYMRISNGYLLSITSTFPVDAGEQTTMNLINSIKRLK